MGQIGSSGKARRDARCGASGERRNTAGGPIWPTEGRVLLRRGVVACLLRCTTGERRNTAGGPIWPTEGRVLLRRGVVACLLRCTTSQIDMRLATAQNHPGQMVPYDQEPL